MNNLGRTMDRLMLEIFEPGLPLKIETEEEKKQFKRWRERKDKASSWQCFTMSIMFTPAGIYVLSTHGWDFFGLLMALGGTLCAVLLFWESLEKAKQRDEKIQKLETEVESLKKLLES